MRRGHGFLAASAALALPALLLAAAALGRAAAAEPSGWDRGGHSRARLVDGGPAPEGPARLAGVDLRLDPGFITYWRDPGEAGVPPAFDFAGSTNLKAATVRYPAPRRIDEAGLAALGYEGDVVFPVDVEPLDPARPVGLRLALSYAVCRDLCLPARAALALTLDGPAPDAALVRDALARVPRPSALGADGPVAIRAVTAEGSGDLSVEASAPAGSALFVEAPDGGIYAPGPGGPRDGRLVFPVKRVEAPAEGSRVRLTLTLVPPAPPGAAPGRGAIEVRADLDAPAKTR